MEAKGWSWSAANWQETTIGWVRGSPLVITLLATPRYPFNFNNATDTGAFNISRFAARVEIQTQGYRYKLCQSATYDTWARIYCSFTVGQVSRIMRPGWNARTHLFTIHPFTLEAFALSSSSHWSGGITMISSKLSWHWQLSQAETVNHFGFHLIPPIHAVIISALCHEFSIWPVFYITRGCHPQKFPLG